MTYTKTSHILHKIKRKKQKKGGSTKIIGTFNLVRYLSLIVSNSYTCLTLYNYLNHHFLTTTNNDLLTQRFGCRGQRS